MSKKKKTATTVNEARKTEDEVITVGETGFADAEEAPTEELYTVQPGDTVSDIAHRFLGSPRKRDVIMRYNNLATNHIKAGLVLRIPQD